MSQPLLSILIPTVVGREEQFHRLVSRLQNTYSGHEVECFYQKDNKEMTIGEKRGLLYQKANGVYGWQIDDDDDVADDAIELILEAASGVFRYDCITFEERCEMNGNIYKSNFSLEYRDWEGDGSVLLYDGFHFHRTPFYKCPILTDIAKRVPFERVRYGEDHAWARAVRPLLEDEYHISKELYIYQHNSKSEEFSERYGYDRH